MSPRALSITLRLKRVAEAVAAELRSFCVFGPMRCSNEAGRGHEHLLDALANLVLGYENILRFFCKELPYSFLVCARNG